MTRKTIEAQNSRINSSSLIAADRLFNKPCSLWMSIQPLGSLQPKEQNHQVNHEQQNDGHFQNQHPAVGLDVVEQLVEVVQRLQFAPDGFVPVGQMKSRGNVFVNARQMPITKEFRGEIGR